MERGLLGVGDGAGTQGDYRVACGQSAGLASSENVTCMWNAWLESAWAECCVSSSHARERKAERTPSTYFSRNTRLISRLRNGRQADSRRSSSAGESVWRP